MSGTWTKVDFLSGKVVWMEDALQEDMLQVEYSNNFILDMGWYQTTYIIYIIQNLEWGDPVARYATQDADNLFELLTKAVKHIEERSRNPCHDLKKQ